MEGGRDRGERGWERWRGERVGEMEGPFYPYNTEYHNGERVGEMEGREGGREGGERGTWARDLDEEGGT